MMQVDKHGNIINDAIYVISGEHRRRMKKKLWTVNNFIKMYWHVEDVSTVYGFGSSEDENNNRMIELHSKKAELEKLLSERLTPTNNPLKEIR